MDFFSHAAWAYLLSRAGKKWRTEWKEFVFFGVLPDLAFGVPLLLLLAPKALEIIAKGFETPVFYTVPVIPVLYAVAHSYLAALAVFVAASAVLKRIYWPVLGWLLHVSLDAFTHKGSVAVQAPLYPLPFQVEGFVHWNNPFFLAANWLALAMAFFLLKRTSPCAPSSPGSAKARPR